MTLVIGAYLWTAQFPCYVLLRAKTPFLVGARALDKRGTPRVLPLHLVQFGKNREALKWEAAQAKPLPKTADSHVLRVQLFKDHVPAKVWIDTSKNVVSAVRSWLTLLKVPADDIIDIFLPRRIGDGIGVSINVRIAQSASARVEAASGVGGFLCRSLPPDNSPAAAEAGSVSWIRREAGEAGETYLARARDLAEKADPCRGLGFSAAGSVGTRVDANSCATSWQAVGLPSSMVGSAFSSWLIENGWTDVDVLARRLRKRGRFSSAQFTFRGKHNDGSLACHTLVATAHDGSDCFVEITPWRPPPRTPKTTAIRQRGLAYERNASAAPPSSSAKTSNDDVILIQPSQTPSAPAPRRNNRDASASEEGARGRSRSPFLRSHMKYCVSLVSPSHPFLRMVLVGFTHWRFISPRLKRVRLDRRCCARKLPITSGTRKLSLNLIGIVLIQKASPAAAGILMCRPCAVQPPGQANWTSSPSQKNMTCVSSLFVLVTRLSW
jgi:hypothetical protein